MSNNKSISPFLFVSWTMDSWAKSSIFGGGQLVPNYNKFYAPQVGHHPAPPKIPGQDFHFFQARQCPGQTVHGQSMECKTFPKCWFYPFLSVDMCVVYIHFMIRICACIQLVIRNAQWPCLSITESVLQVG